MTAGKQTPFTEGAVVRIPFTVTQDQMDRYRKLSGDLNPLHADKTFARRYGFQGPVVFGGLLVAMISRLIGSEFPGSGWIWHSLSLQFKKPLFVNEPAEVIGTIDHVNPAVGVLSLRIEIACQDRSIAEGAVQSGRLKET